MPFFVRFVLLAAESWRSLFRPAISAVNWSVRSWFKREFCDFGTTFSAFPVSFHHFTRSKAPSSRVIKFIECHRIFVCLIKRPLPGFKKIARIYDSKVVLCERLIVYIHYTPCRQDVNLSKLASLFFSLFMGMINIEVKIYE
ncbi:MAG: hypothetical protein A3A98_01345 [Candidatus Staskawiczbacteria bacterium RIFCSPLOWO2_01_FULL_40_39]|uniref:Uncharacterized protein n=1 Tax=Candidatus Staskawiczbacteria bacterium RIFCSPHIGHO2_01_FULL_39_25 TaxID=1802202 RepID=A0A1G2HNA7_9BACT|nr:MAG: hypothetical protein A2730_01345 [Candidatus Staskawiczbacteria bacterium RIFCSPHIGHO2_01_FULL_39_25]OGZ73373.1 MAG: hypothetical protein A3A98_01345 [Candidatus Staskawiczbacteria bacterium RIFCSPLOWO2_01_FULL_40_39]